MDDIENIEIPGTGNDDKPTSEEGSDMAYSEENSAVTNPDNTGNIVVGEDSTSIEIPVDIVPVETVGDNTADEVSVESEPEEINEEIQPEEINEESETEEIVEEKPDEEILIESEPVELSEEIPEEVIPEGSASEEIVEEVIVEEIPEVSVSEEIVGDREPLEISKEMIPEEIPSQVLAEAKWYAIRTYTGHESKVKLSIESEVKRRKLQNKIFDVIIPQETVFEVRGGKRRTKVRNFLPGYIIMQAAMDKKIIEIISNIPSIVSFVGAKSQQPAPLQQHEVDRIIGRVEERRSIATIETSFQIGDPVKVIEGPFTNFNGTVKEVNNEKQKLKVEVGILGRKTPVELDFSQVEPENH
jgi:transcriptional antiterminator NusG